MPQISESKMKWQNIIGRKDKKGYLCAVLQKRPCSSTDRIEVS